MASFIAGLLTVFLVINCVLLILLVLIQLPKKDAGAGLAFGGGAADALFGAGSGNVLTKVTKWAVVVFFVMALFLGYLQDKLHTPGGGKEFEKQLQQKQMEMPPVTGSQPVAPTAASPGMLPAAQPAAAPANNSASAPLTASSNAPAAPAQSK
ncbi:MAG TPA: preprotein translocase subunit SecG [Candidatus Acidoferrum sp.]|nr:preprotein translocase subunit SecG [Candidatus Acidoferrum sp.]